MSDKPVTTDSLAMFWFVASLVALFTGHDTIALILLAPPLAVCVVLLIWLYVYAIREEWRK